MPPRRSRLRRPANTSGSGEADGPGAGPTVLVQGFLRVGRSVLVPQGSGSKVTARVAEDAVALVGSGVKVATPEPEQGTVIVVGMSSIT